MSRSPAKRSACCAFLLRALLCVALLANGIGAAGASARVAVLGVASVVAERVTTETPPAADCHGSGIAAAAPGVPTAHASHGPSLDAATHVGHGDDCAQFCLDICLQHCPVVIALAVPFALTIRTGAPLTHAGTGRAPAPQSPLLRPPIA